MRAGTSPQLPLLAAMAGARERSRSPEVGARDFQLTLLHVAAPDLQAPSPCRKPRATTLQDLCGQLRGGRGWRPPPTDGAPRIPCAAVCDWRATDAAVRDAFSLSAKQAYPTTTLERRNATARCARCVFDEATHVYAVDGVRVPWSGTKFSHMCEHGFDADATLDAYYSEEWARRKGLVQADGAPLAREAVKAHWAENGEVQSRRGTLMHWHIECHLNGYALEPPHSVEFEMYLHFERAFLQPLGLEPWRTEMNLFHCGLRLAGQADLVCRAEDGRLVILDWKRSRDIKASGFRGQRQRPPLAHLPDCNLWTYCLQLNTYRHMLESEYELPVAGMFIVVLHPEQAPRGAHVYEVPRLEAEIAALVEHAAALHGTALEPHPGATAPFDVAALRF